MSTMTSRHAYSGWVLGLIGGLKISLRVTQQRLKNKALKLPVLPAKICFQMFSDWRQGVGGWPAQVEQGPTKPHCNQKRKREKKKRTPLARSSGRARHFELQSINVEGSAACPLFPPTTTFSNLYDTPHTSEKTAGITLCRRRHTFPPRAVVFIRDPLLKAAQEFLMYSNVFATAVA